MAIVLVIYFFEGLLCTLIGMPSASPDTCEIVSLVLMLVNSVILVIYVTKRYKIYGKAVVSVLVLSVLLKVFLILWDYYGTSIFVLPNSHSDTEEYHWTGMNYALYGMRVRNYGLLVGVIYKLFGVQRMTAQYLNVVFSFIGISFFERTMLLLELSRQTREKTMKFAALLPNYLIISAILLRECLISMIVAISLYCFAQWWKKGNSIKLLFAFAISLSACYFHSGAVAVTVGYAVVVILTKTQQSGGRKFDISIKSVLFAVLFFFGFMFLFTRYSDSLFKRFGGMSVEVIDQYIEGHDFYGTRTTPGRNSKYYAGISGYTGLAGILINSPIRTIYFLWVPMPWDIRGLGDIIAFLGSSLFYGGTMFSAIFSLVKRKNISRDKTLLFAIMSIALCGAFVFAWGTESAGSALRHREKFYFAYLLLYGVLKQFKEGLPRKSIVSESV